MANARQFMAARTAAWAKAGGNVWLSNWSVAGDGTGNVGDIDSQSIYYHNDTSSMTFRNGYSISFWAKNKGVHGAAIKYGGNWSGISLGAGSEYESADNKIATLIDGMVWHKYGDFGTGWNHYAFTASSSSSTYYNMNYKVYQNGLMIGSFIAGVIAYPRSGFEGYEECGGIRVLGYFPYERDMSQTYNRLFNGCITRLAIFGRELSSTDVYNDYIFGKIPPSDTSLEHFYSMYHENGRAKDLVGSWDLTRAGTAFQSEDTPWS